MSPSMKLDDRFYATVGTENVAGWRIPQRYTPHLLFAESGLTLCGLRWFNLMYRDTFDSVPGHRSVCKRCTARAGAMS